MNCTIDIGNTSTKIGIFSKNRIVFFQKIEDYSYLINLFKIYTIKNIFICDVSDKLETLLSYIPKNIPIQILNFKTKLPIESLYETPQTLGMDRIAAVVGAYARYSTCNCLVIDAGSCITYDFLSVSHQYLGGYISLGLQMRFKALEHFTAKLPLISSQDFVLSHIGRTTHDAIQGGVVNGFIYEIEGVIQNYIHNSSNVRVLICGGDANFIHKNIRQDSEVIETLVLEGLQAIYSHIQ